jgi:hypothetical protein
MPSPDKTLIDLEMKFWQSMLDEDADTAIEMLHEPALMVSQHGAMKFNHADYRKMAEQGKMVLKAFELDDMQVVFPNDSTAILTYRVTQDMAKRGESDTTTEEMLDSSTWIKAGKSWQCVMHTETPAGRMPG